MEAPPVDRELWAEYAVGALFIIARFAVRAKVIGVKNFGLEDLLMFVALLSYTAITAIIHLITRHGATIGQTAESVYLLPEEVVASMIIGQKLTFVDWYIYLVYVWCLKATLLAMFWKLVQGLHREKLIWKVVAGYTAVAAVGAVLTHTCCCLPIHHSWQVQPYPGDRCALRDLNYYLVTFFNASSDVAIICVPLPIIFRAKIPLWRRLLLVFLLCSGAFVAVCAILRAYYSLQDLTLLPIAAGWTSRETFVAAVVVSIPGIKPIFSHTTWFRFRSTANPSYDHSGNRRNVSELVTIGGSGAKGTGYETGSKGRSEWTVNGKELKGTRLSSDGSEDIILSSNGEDPAAHIRVTSGYQVSHEPGSRQHSA